MSVSIDRLLALPCIEGFRLYLSHMRRYPDLNEDELLSHIYAVEADAHTLDMDAAVYMSKLVEADYTIDTYTFYQTCIKSVLINHNPIWVKLMRRGRLSFIESLTRNYRDCRDVFEAAGLLEFPISHDVVLWWDTISGMARLASDNEKMKQGRAAEILTIEREREYLRKIGINKEPEWPGLDNNFAGYDVLSYDFGESGMINKLIEVKSTMISPLRFILTRNEWNKAIKAGKRYIFHIWDMNKVKPELHIRTVDEVKPHVPNDNGNGEWKNTEIPVQSRK